MKLSKQGTTFPAVAVIQARSNVNWFMISAVQIVKMGYI